SAVERHGIVDGGDAVERLDQLIKTTWERRGRYPGLGSVVNQLAHLADAAPGHEELGGAELVASIRASVGTGDLLDETFQLLRGTGKSASVAGHEKVLSRARRGLADRAHLEPLLRKLSLFSLTTRQVGRIACPDPEDDAFEGSAPSPAEIAA